MNFLTFEQVIPTKQFPTVVFNQTAKTLRISPENKKFNTNRHPRTAIGIQSDGDLIMVTVDGRNAMAQGMSIPELSQLMRALDCIDAMNMDGGGSTSMWIKDMPEDGIVNYPSDNGKFDHQGQRTVANIIGLVRRE